MFPSSTLADLEQKKTSSAPETIDLSRSLPKADTLLSLGLANNLNTALPAEIRCGVPDAFCILFFELVTVYIKDNGCREERKNAKILTICSKA